MKKGFTLFEVLVSLVIFAIVLSGIQKLFVDHDTIPTYYELQKIENNYIQTGTVIQSEKIQFKTH